MVNWVLDFFILGAPSLPACGVKLSWGPAHGGLLNKRGSTFASQTTFAPTSFKSDVHLLWCFLANVGTTGKRRPQWWHRWDCWHRGHRSTRQVVPRSPCWHCGHAIVAHLKLLAVHHQPEQENWNRDLTFHWGYAGHLDLERGGQTDDQPWFTTKKGNSWKMLVNESQV